MGDEETLTIAEQRARDARQREQLRQSQTLIEAEQAQKHIDAFLVRAREAGCAPVPLVARTLSGTSVKTKQRGWYLRNDHSVAVGADGKYYLLTVPGGGVLDRFRTISLTPSPPPLEVGRGGREGETGDLTFFLERVLRGEVTA